MTDHQNTHQRTCKPPITDLWLLVDEEQTLHFGLRQAWRWLDAQQLQTGGMPRTTAVHAHRAQAHACCRAVASAA